MQTKSFPFQENSPTGIQSSPYAKVFSSTPPQWGTGMATWTRCPILKAPPQTDVPQYLYIITLTHEHGDSKQKIIAVLLALLAVE